MKKVLFVCLGNICRSPLAEAIFNDKINKMGLTQRFSGESCGTANYHIGDRPDPRTLKNALRNGITIDHLGRQLCTDDFGRYDHIFVMDRSNFQHASKMTPEEHRDKIKLMRSYDPLGKDEDVPDPYYGAEKDFQEVFEILDRTIGAFIETELMNGKR